MLHVIPASLWGFHLHRGDSQDTSSSLCPALGWHQGTQGKPQQLWHTPESSSPQNHLPEPSVCLSLLGHWAYSQWEWAQLINQHPQSASCSWDFTAPQFHPWCPAAPALAQPCPGFLPCSHLLLLSLILLAMPWHSPALAQLCPGLLPCSHLLLFAPDFFIISCPGTALPWSLTLLLTPAFCP